MNKSYKIKPAGRHILTIGRDLIKDKYAAIVELVKNSYDADSPLCKISLLPFERKITKESEEYIEKGIKVVVQDTGHGMTLETVTEKWMVPSTDDKLIRKLSPNGRLLQGRKGIGRYSASIIGKDLLLETIDENGGFTTLYLEWEDFQKAKYLQDVDILIENSKANEPSGTKITIIGDEDHLNEWNEKQLKNLKSELKKLIPPVDKTIGDINHIDDFKIILELGRFPYEKYFNKTETIEPYPLFDLFDYRISGTITKDGVANLVFENKRTKDRPEKLEKFTIAINQSKDKNLQSFCGVVSFDFRVFDRDPSSIDALIERGLKDPITGESVGKREARIILDTYNGIGVYRQGFRIRPLGDAGFDWLSLDNERVQNPSLRVGSDQIIGFIHIEPEERSGLEEKSARDGLKETSQYFGLIEISKQVLKELENRRFAYRQRVGLGRSKRNINEKIKGLFDFKDFKQKINTELDELGVDPEKRDAINEIIFAKQEKSNVIANELKQVIALYQGHATIGKIVNVILHEGRKPLAYFKNQIPLITEWNDELREGYKEDLLSKVLVRLSSIKEQGEIFSNLFSKLDPLSAKKRQKKIDFQIYPVIENTLDVFASELKLQNIQTNIYCDKKQTVYGWKEDYYIILTNLIDNSIYWLQTNNKSTKEINIKVYEKDEVITIEYRDNGPGIPKEFIESEIIFEPQFSNKTGGGTGLGLAIAGEAIERNNGTLSAIESSDGAFFKIETRV